MLLNIDIAFNSQKIYNIYGDEKMSYNATIKYEGKTVNIKVTVKAYEGTHDLPNFLKLVRETKGHTLQTTHMLTDYPIENVKTYEEGTQEIPQKYLKCFAHSYRIPMKIANLGHIPKEDIKNILATRIKQLRLENDIPQVIVASELEIARSTYAGYEIGKNEPDIYTLVKIADYYKVSLDYLVGRY